MIREAEEKDLEGLLLLYAQLHDEPVPEKDERIPGIWKSILTDEANHIIVAEENSMLVSSCVCMIIPNLTHDQHPYAFIENVITDIAHRNKGFATACLEHAREIAEKEGCCKMMLLTGSKKKSTLDFYESAGYNKNDKTAFIRWL